MKAVIAIDSFKGSLTSREAGEAAALGIKRAFSTAECELFLIADGGEGTVEAVTSALGGDYIDVTCHDPLMRGITARYGYVESRGLAVIEMAQASGLPLLKEDERDPIRATTYGTGELILDALDRGARELIIGIGGSATNDGGIGMLSALGARFLDEERDEISPNAAGIASLESIELSGLRDTSDVKITVACDVTNPLLGELGCASVFAPQKGADEETVRELDRLMARFAEKTRELLPDTDDTRPGSGAAGGLGFALMSYLSADFAPGIELVLAASGIECAIAECDLVITGEGRLDAQSAMGKATSGVASLARRHGKPTVALSGCIGEGSGALHDAGITAYFPILQTPCTLEEAMEKERAQKNLASCAEQVARLFSKNETR